MAGFVEAIKLSKVYDTPSGPLPVVEDFDLEIKNGEFITLIGHSGCGKSTVLQMIAGLNEISDGNVILDAREIDGPGPDRGVVFQAPSLLPWMSAKENVLLGINQVYAHEPDTVRNQIAEYHLTLVGLGGVMNKRPGEMSGGMRQRVGLARAFALSPKMLLLDEPFGMLDSLTRVELQEILLDIWNDDQLTALMVTHDVDEALFLSDRVVMMTSGPRAKVGQILEIPFGRPRDRSEVLEHPSYYELRGQLISFLEEEDKNKNAAA